MYVNLSTEGTDHYNLVTKRIGLRLEESKKKKKKDITCKEHASFSYRALKLHFFICHCVPSLLAEVLTCVKQKTLFTFGDQQTTQGYVSYIGFSAYFGFVRTFICKIVTNNVHAFPTTLYRCKLISPFRWRSVSSLIVTNFLYNLFNCNVSARKFLHRRPIIFFAILFTSCSCRAHKHRMFNEMMTFTTSYFLHDLQVDLA